MAVSSGIVTIAGKLVKYGGWLTLLMMMSRYSAPVVYVPSLSATAIVSLYLDCSKCIHNLYHKYS